MSSDALVCVQVSRDGSRSRARCCERSVLEPAGLSAQKRGSRLDGSWASRDERAQRNLANEHLQARSPYGLWVLTCCRWSRLSLTKLGDALIAARARASWHSIHPASCEGLASNAMLVHVLRLFVSSTSSRSDARWKPHTCKSLIQATGRGRGAGIRGRNRMQTRSTSLYRCLDNDPSDAPGVRVGDSH